MKRASLDDLKLLATSPDADYRARFNFALKLASDERMADALEPANASAEALTADASPETVSSVIGLAAFVNLETGNSAAAEKLLQKLESKPPSLYVYLATAEASRRKRHVAGAIDLLIKAVQLYPESASAADRLGICLMQTGNYAPARLATERAVALRSDVARYHADLAQALGELRLYSESNAHLQRAVDLSSGNPVFAPLAAIGRAYSARTRDEYHLAVRELTGLRSASPDSEKLCLVLSGLHMRFREFTAARREAESAIAINPASTDAWLKVATATERAGDHRAAQRAYARYQSLTDLRQSVVDARNEALLHPSNVDNLVRLADLFAESGRTDQALQALQSAIALRPGDKGIGERLSRLSGLRGLSGGVQP